MFFAEGARKGLNFVFRPQYLVATGPRGKINAGESRELVTDGRETEELTPRNLLWEPVVNKSVFRYLGRFLPFSGGLLLGCQLSQPKRGQVSLSAMKTNAEAKTEKDFAVCHPPPFHSGRLGYTLIRELRQFLPGTKT